MRGTNCEVCGVAEDTKPLKRYCFTDIQDFCPIAIPSFDIPVSNDMYLCFDCKENLNG